MDFVSGLDGIDRAPLWGLSPEERLLAPSFFDAIDRLGQIADSFHPEFGTAFSDVSVRKAKVRGFAAASCAFFRLGVAADARNLDVDTLLTGYSEPKDHFDEAGEFEFRFALSSQTMDAAQASQAEVIASKLAAQSPVDATLFLARIAPFAERNPDRIRLLKPALATLPAFPTAASRRNSWRGSGDPYAWRIGTPAD